MLSALLAPWGKDPCLRLSEMRIWSVLPCPMGRKCSHKNRNFNTMLAPWGKDSCLRFGKFYNLHMFCFALWGENRSRRNRDFDTFLCPMGQTLST